jgi:hypothetical protein
LLLKQSNFLSAFALISVIFLFLKYLKPDEDWKPANEETEAKKEDFESLEKDKPFEMKKYSENI